MFEGAVDVSSVLWSSGERVRMEFSVQNPFFFFIVIVRISIKITELLTSSLCTFK